MPDFKHPVVYDPRTGKLFSDPRLGVLDEIVISSGGAVTSVEGRTGAVLISADDVGLGSVDNTSDLAKPVSNATQAAINSAVAGISTGVTSIDGQTGVVTLGDINLDNVDNTSDANKPVSTAQQTALDLKADASALAAKADASDLNTIEWTLTANGSSDYIFSGPGFTGTITDPTLYVMRGHTYKFTNNMNAHPFRIQSTTGTSGTAYNDGITNNTVSNGTLVWTVQMNAPSTLYYQCTAHAAMNGTINVLA